MSITSCSTKTNEFESLNIRNYSIGERFDAEYSNNTKTLLGSASIKDGLIKSTISIKDKKTNKIINSSFDLPLIKNSLDTNTDVLKNSLLITLENDARKFLRELESKNINYQEMNNEIEEITFLVSDFLRDISKEFTKNKDNIFSSHLIYHYTMLNSSKRMLYSLEKNKIQPDVICSFSTSHLIKENTPFCLEDMLMPVETFQKRLLQKGYTLSDIGLSELQQTELKSLTHIDGTTFLNIVESKTKANPTPSGPYECPEGAQGCTLGCCGNYEGDCNFCAWECLYHDAWCMDCDQGIWCGFQCEPGVCESPTPVIN